MKWLLKRCTCVLLIFWLLGTLATAQTWPVLRYTPREGMSGMQCMSIFRDSRGLIWIGTKSGLSRFNGKTFENFHVKDGLLGEQVKIIGEDSKGYLWLEQDYRGLMRFDGQVFKPFLLPDAGHIKSTIGLDDEIITVDYKKKQPYHLVGDTLLPLRWRGVPPSFYTRNEGISYHKASKSYLCRVGDSLFVFKNQQLRFLAAGYTFSGTSLAYGDVHLQSFLKPNGEKYLARWDGHKLQHFLTTSTTGQPRILATLPYDFVFTHAYFTYLLNRNSRNYEVISDYYTNDVEYGDSPENPTVIRYLATEKGLLGLVKNGFKSFTEAQVPYAWSVVEDRHGDHYFLNFRHSLQKFDGKTLQTIKNPAVTIDQDWYYDALRDKLGNLWMPRQWGILHYDNVRWQSIQLPTPASVAFCMAENKAQNTIVVGSTQGLYFIENRPPFRRRFQTGTALIYQNPMCVAVAPDGTYWFGGYGTAHYDSLKHHTTFYNRDNHKLPTGTIMSLFFDKAGTLWAGSARRGLFKFNPQKDNFERVLADCIDGMVPIIEQFDDQHLLIADLNNLYLMPLSGKKEGIRCFNHHNGFMGVEPGQLGSYCDSKGKIWITSGTVLSVLDPAQLDLRPASLQARITHLSQPDTLPLRLPFVREKKAVVALPFGQNTVSFTVEAVGEDQPFESQYSYRVAGFANQWSDWQTQNLIAINNLPNGIFTLEVKTRRGLLATESAAVTLPFKVSIWVWQSPNFYKYAALLCLLLTAGITYFWQRDRKNQRHILVQQKNIENRERDVRFLQVQTIQAQMNPHFTFNVLGTIQHLIASNNTQKANENLLKLSHLMRSYLDSSILSNEKNSSLYANEIPLAREIELLKLYIEFEQLQYEGKFSYQLTTDGKLNLDNYRIPPLLIQPFVENAIKHGLLYKETAGELLIRFIALGDETLVCTIEDDGVGREAARQIQANSLRKYKSHGTGLVQKRKELLNEMGYDITIQTDDRLQGGTVVTIQIGYAP